MIHSDQGSQYGSHDYLDFMREHNPIKRHSHIGGIAPMQFVANYYSKRLSV
jgi:hypothetical protein